MALKVMPNEVEGWDVVRDEDGVALTNHLTREQALEAARMRAREEGDPDTVEVDPRHVHQVDDARQGVKPAILALLALLVAVTILVVVLALTGSLTGFGS